MLARRSRRQLLALLLTTIVITVTACYGGDGDAREFDPTPPSKSASSAESAPTSPDPAQKPTKEPPGMRVRSTFFGMHDGRLSQGIAPEAPIGSFRLWDSGTTWVHLETSPGEFSWDPLDTAVSTAASVGARPLLVLGQTPTFHASRPREEALYGSGAASPPDLGAWRRYLGAVAERYGNRIDYQIWNEPNVIGFWTGTQRQMAGLTIEAARVIRRAVPNATVVAPSFVLRLRSQREMFEAFWSLQSRGVGLTKAVDAVPLHLYPTAEALPEDQGRLLEFARGVLSKHEIDRPVWNGEINYGLLNGTTEPPPISEERQRAFLMRTYLLNAGLGVERVYWYAWNIGRIANTYLTEKDLSTETLAGRSFDVVRDWLAGTRVEGCGLTGTERGVWECRARMGREERTFWWKPRGTAARIVAEGARSWTSPDGVVTRCHGMCHVPVGESPVMVVARR